MTPRGRFAPALLVAVLLLVGAGCGDDDASEGGTEPTAELSVEPSPEATVEPTAEPSPESVQPLRILVTNDDGVGAEGIDVVVEALRTLPDVEITVVAPAENQSGTGDTLSDVAPPAEEAATLSGYPATAVSGTPGDSVRHALDVVFAGNPPDLIVSGSNEGQNVCPWAELSGTVGAARIGARAGVPAFAISQAALGVEPDFATEDAGISLEPPNPKLMRQQNDAASFGGVGLFERSAENGCDVEGVEQVCCHQQSAERFGAGVSGKRQILGEAEPGKALE